MRSLMTTVAVAAVLASPVLCLISTAEEAGGTAKTGGERQKHELTDMTFTGAVTKEEHQTRDGKAEARYILTDAAGNKVVLGGRHGRKEGAEASSVKPEDYVGKQVTATGKGFKMERKGAQYTILAQIAKIEVVGDASAAAPATTPAAPAQPAPQQ